MRSPAMPGLRIDHLLLSPAVAARFFPATHLAEPVG
jgi:exonuclease III